MIDKVKKKDVVLKLVYKKQKREVELRLSEKDITKQVSDDIAKIEILYYGSDLCLMYQNTANKGLLLISVHYFDYHAYVTAIPAKDLMERDKNYLSVVITSEVNCLRVNDTWEMEEL